MLCIQYLPILATGLTARGEKGLMDRTAQDLPRDGDASGVPNAWRNACVQSVRRMHEDGEVGGCRFGTGGRDIRRGVFNKPDVVVQMARVSFVVAL